MPETIPPPTPTEIMAIADLKPHPKNYREHGPGQIKHIVASIKEHGIYRNVVVAQDGTILAGHGVVKAALAMGRETIPVVRVPLDANSPLALKLLAGDNEISRGAKQDDRMLAGMLDDIRKAMHDDPMALLGTGYDEQQLANLLMVTRNPDEIGEQIDPTEHWTGMPEYDEVDPQSLIEAQVVVIFKNAADCKAFSEQMQIKVFGKTPRSWFARWPEQALRDIKSVRFVAGDAPEEP